MTKIYLDESNCYKKTFLKKSKNLQKLINETLFILEELGIPIQTKTPRQKEKTALSFLTLGQINVGIQWSKLQDNTSSQLNSKDVLRKINKSFGEEIKVGSYDDIRRVDLIELTNAEIIQFFPLGAKNNSPSRKFGISTEYADVIRTFGSPKWTSELKKIVKKYGKYVDHLNPKQGSVKISQQKINGRKQLSIKISDTRTEKFANDEHNYLQKQIIEVFRKRFANNGEVLYVGDTDDKLKVVNEEKLKSIKFFEIKHDILPDVVIYDEKNNWVFLVDAFDSTNPMSPNRVFKLKKMLKKCTAGIIFVTAFRNLTTFSGQCKNIAFETEVWMAELPKNMIHYNGHKFLGPY